MILPSCFPFRSALCVAALYFFAFGSVGHAAPQLPRLPEGNYVTVNGARLWYISEGQGEPIVIISGGPGAAHYLYPYFSALALTHRVIYLDSYGCGNSDRAASSSQYTFARHVDEIEGLRQALKLEKINLIGHSYGGIVAQAFAIKYPGSVKRLILANTFFNAEMWQAGIDFGNQMIKLHYPAVWAAMQELHERGVSPLTKEWADVVGQIPASFIYNADFTNEVPLNLDMNPSLLYTLFGRDADFTVGGEFTTFDTRAGLKNLTLPVLVIAGRMDRVALPAYTEQFKALIPRATFVMVERGGHNLFQEENAQMLEALRAFLSVDAASPDKPKTILR